MSKEAMKLALEALENSRSLEPVGVQWVKGKRHAAITALREALAEQPAQQEFVSPGGGYVPAIPVQQPLDKKAENARELGLDYEPVQDGGIVTAGGFDPRTRRTWVGLTDEEYREAEKAVWAVISLDDTEKEANREFYEAIEAKLKEKNT